MDAQTRRLLERVSTEQYVTSAQVAEALGISQKTAQQRLKQLDGELKRHGARLIARQRAGYRLEITDADRYEQWKETLWKEEGKLPETTSERVRFLLACLLNRTDYIKLEDLSQFLCVSRNTVTANLKQAESILNEFYLKIERRPNYGIRVEGSELDKRTCIARYLTEDGLRFKGTSKQREDLRALSEIVKEAAAAYAMHFSEHSYESLLHYLYVSNSRIRRGLAVDGPQKEQEEIRQSLRDKFLEAAACIARQTEKKTGVAYSPAETLYLALQLGGKAWDGVRLSYSHIVISERIDGLALRMIQAVYEVNRLDFRDNLELRMSLNQHLVPLDIRMRYHIFLKNPLLEQVKQKYAYAYMLAATACTALKAHYGKRVPEDEIGYIAVIFALAMEKQDKAARRYNIVMVCISGHGASRLFMHKYKTVFGKYINQIYECTVFDLEHMDFQKKAVDYVFTTVPLPMSLPVPVLEISLFLNDAEIHTYTQMFEHDDCAFLTRYFDPELFLAGVEGESKDAVLRTLCGWAASRRPLPEDFYELVMRREEMGQTDFGNLVAIPHPCHTVSEEKFVLAAVLARPVWWGRHDVQVVLLVSLTEEQDEDTEGFYRAVTNFLSNRELVEQAIAQPEFPVLLEQLKRAARM